MIRIITDSTSEISQERAKKLGIEVFPLQISFSGETFKDGINITHDEFYKKLAVSKNLPTTSQPAPDAFVPLFLDAAEKGDSVIAIMISSKLSGTLQSVHIAKEISGYDDIHIIDSLNVVTGLQLMVEQAAALRDSGKTVDEIVAAVNSMIPRIAFFALVDTLEYLYKGGRLSRAAKIAGGFLGFKPILTLIDGELKVVGKARGTKKGITAMLDKLDTIPAPAIGTPFYFGFTENDEKCTLLREQVCEKLNIENEIVSPVGCTIGTHAGPGACIITYLTESDVIA